MCESIIASCKTCGTPFHPSKYKSSKFCGMPCYRAHQRSGSYKTREAKRIYDCSNCGEKVTGRSFSRDASGAISEKIYCGRACYDAARSSAQKSLEKKCIGCGEMFYRSGVMLDAVYCNAKCRTAHNMPSPVTCISCGCLFSAIQLRSGASKWYVRMTNRKTCSSECLTSFYKEDQSRKDKIGAAFKGEKHPNWQGGTHRQGNRGAGWNATAEKCRDLHRRKCKNCGMDESVGLARGWGRLQVNHITPFHQTLNKRAANLQSNLEALCKSCHTKADWKWRKENSVQMSLDIFTGH